MTTRTLGELGGEEWHKLRENEMPLHNHGGNTMGGNPISFRVVNPANGSGKNIHAGHTTGWAGGDYVDCNNAEYPVSQHTHAIKAAGGHDAHNNIVVIKS